MKKGETYEKNSCIRIGQFINDDRMYQKAGNDDKGEHEYHTGNTLKYRKYRQYIFKPRGGQKQSFIKAGEPGNQKQRILITKHTEILQGQV